jgi:biopolymer transport protein ExbB
MQRVAAWKSWALFIGMFCAVLLAREAVTTLVPAAATALLAQDEPAGGAADAPAGGGGAPGGSEGPRRQQTYLGWFFEALGITYSLAFLFISFTFVAVLVMNLLSVRRDAICPRHLAEAFEAHLNEKKFQEAFDLAKSDESMLGQMLASGMQNLQTGYDKAVDAMGTVGEEENLKLEQRLSYISLIGTISPMVGLLGTVHGMVGSFQVIAIAGTTPKASDLAKGISMALVTTLVGLAIAIPAIIAFNLLKNRLTRLTLEVGLQADSLMSRFETMGKKT